MKHIAAAVAMLAAIPAQAAVTVTVEAAGVQNTSANFTQKGVETFTGRSTGSFTTDFGTGGLFTGKYANVQINNADQYGGAGGEGQYSVTFNNPGYMLDLSSSLGPVTYFGYHLPALDAGNQVAFYRNGEVVYTFSPANLLEFVGGKSAYYGNPNPNFAGQNTHEPYAFVNFYFSGGIDSIAFNQTTGGGYESDNHTVGFWTTPITGTVIETSAVPEPATWAMMILGFGMVGAASRRRGIPTVSA